MIVLTSLPATAVLLLVCVGVGHAATITKLNPARAIQTALTTCGFFEGDPSKSRTADSGFNCRVDTLHGLWGFCPTTVIAATDCGLAGNCIDRHACSSGCGIGRNPTITTFTCSETNAPFCSTALLTFGVDQTYSYIACGAVAHKVLANSIVGPKLCRRHLTPNRERTAHGHCPDVAPSEFHGILLVVPERLDKRK